MTRAGTLPALAARFIPAGTQEQGSNASVRIIEAIVPKLRWARRRASIKNDRVRGRLQDA
jgi:hypothetical protein